MSASNVQKTVISAIRMAVLSTSKSFSSLSTVEYKCATRLSPVAKGFKVKTGPKPRVSPQVSAFFSDSDNIFFGL